MRSDSALRYLLEINMLCSHVLIGWKAVEFNHLWRRSREHWNPILEEMRL